MKPEKVRNEARPHSQAARSLTFLSFGLKTPCSFYPSAHVSHGRNKWTNRKSRSSRKTVFVGFFWEPRWAGIPQGQVLFPSPSSAAVWIPLRRSSPNQGLGVKLEPGKHILQDRKKGGGPLSSNSHLIFKGEKLPMWWGRAAGSWGPGSPVAIATRLTRIFWYRSWLGPQLGLEGDQGVGRPQEHPFPSDWTTHTPEMWGEASLFRPPSWIWGNCFSFATSIYPGRLPQNLWGGGCQDSHSIWVTQSSKRHFLFCFLPPLQLFIWMRYNFCWSSFPAWWIFTCVYLCIHHPDQEKMCSSLHKAPSCPFLEVSSPQSDFVTICDFCLSLNFE